MANSPLASPSAASALLARHGLSTKKALGQHLLVDDNVVGRILELADVGSDDVVLEVGPGIGTLTVPLCARARWVLAVERDRDLLPALAETTRDCPSLTLLRADAVRLSAGELVTASGPPTAFVANLPYAVAATLVLKYLSEVPSILSVTVMVQSEVADRMTAAPGGKDYGAYTVKLALIARCAGRFAVSRGCFLPPPRVDSAVVRLERASRDEPAAVLSAAAVLANAAFAQRRKTLRNSVSAALPAALADLDEVLGAADIDGSRRGETLSVDEFTRLARKMREKGLLP